jgi:hypothetical protein
MKSSVTWPDDLVPYLHELIGGIEGKTQQRIGREIAEIMRTNVRMWKNGIYTGSHNNRVVGVINGQREMTASQINALKGKKKFSSSAIPIYPVDTMGDLMNELKNHPSFKKRTPEQKETMRDIREEQQAIARAMKESLPPEDMIISPPPEPPSK